MISSAEALARLVEGNRRFVAGLGNHDMKKDHSRRLELVADQDPFAIILGCSDSRVPSELIFDQGLGDLFVIRVAGNIAARSQIGSIEYAAGSFGTPLVVVLGHTQCGAVVAAVDKHTRQSGEHSPNLGFIVDSIQPCVESVCECNPELDRKSLVERTVHANIRTTVHKLQSASKVLEPMLKSGQLRIVGAEYSIETGRVAFLEDTL